ncbi:MAG TPA: RnfABCDGE type electron transport complex subunit B [Gemmatimonadaceae bacterium]|nr:RnfABCDGE type electron transport complex subunit B [Gemmatimonadaceae bacterium]
MILQAILILGGVGLVFGVFIALANKRLWVWEDPRIDIIAQMLPNANCGACGLPGCRAFAEQAVAGKVQPAQCTVSGQAAREQIADYLGVDAGESVRNVARLLCGGGRDVTAYQAEYRGLSTCAAAAAVAGGGKACAWGCLGLADCERVCEFDAIQMSATGLPIVDIDKCTACGDCVEACPKSLFELRPVNANLLVQCRNLIAGDDVLEQCKVACTACGKCVQDAAAGLISVATGVAVLNYQQIASAEPRATERCPTGAIVWLSGAQFRQQASLVGGLAQ